MCSLFFFPFSVFQCVLLHTGVLTQLHSPWQKSVNPFDGMMYIGIQRANRTVIVHWWCPHFLRTFEILCTFYLTPQADVAQSASKLSIENSEFLGWGETKVRPTLCRKLFCLYLPVQRFINLAFSFQTEEWSRNSPPQFLFQCSSMGSLSFPAQHEYKAATHTLTLC